MLKKKVVGNGTAPKDTGTKGGRARFPEGAQAIKAAAKQAIEPKRVLLATDLVLSTGSTLVDLAISGGRVRGGGVPGGILVEVFGPSSAGKTAILVELGASGEHKGGMVRYQDPEARLDLEVTRLYGLSINKDQYFRPNTVTEMMDNLLWVPENQNVINVDCVDSLAALSTNLEMDKGDKMGMRRAKEFSEGFRKLARGIASHNRLLVCSNQMRQGDYGEVTPGGKAVEYYSSLRLRVGKKDDIKRITTLKNDVKVEKIVGIMSEVIIRKSSIDDPFRKAPLYIIFGVGIDDVRGNLQWLKDMKKESTYVVDGKTYQSMEQAIAYVEKANLEMTIREEVIDLWEEIEARFASPRKPKQRF